MKKNKIILIASMTLCASGMNFAATAKGEPVAIGGVYSIEAITKVSAFIKDMVSAFENKAKGIQTSLKARAEQLQKEFEAYQAKKSTMSQSAQVQEERRLEKLKKDLDESAQEAAQDLERMQQQMQFDVMQTIRKIAADISKKYRIALLELETGFITCAVEDIRLDDEFKNELDKDFLAAQATKKK